MDRRAVEAALRRLKRDLGGDWITFYGRDGKKVEVRAGAALDAFLHALGQQDPGLPPAAAVWIATQAMEGESDITGVIVRHYRKALESEEGQA